jgi:hypothetical protein
LPGYFIAFPSGTFMHTSVVPLVSITAFSVSSLHKLHVSVEDQGNPQIPVEFASAAEFQKRNLFEAFGGFVTDARN